MFINLDDLEIKDIKDKIGYLKLLNKTNSYNDNILNGIIPISYDDEYLASELEPSKIVEDTLFSHPNGNIINVYCFNVNENYYDESEPDYNDLTELKELYNINDQIENDILCKLHKDDIVITEYYNKTISEITHLAANNKIDLSFENIFADIEDILTSHLVGKYIYLIDIVESSEPLYEYKIVLIIRKCELAKLYKCGYDLLELDSEYKNILKEYYNENFKC